jgi:hypothetical protein
MQALSAQLSPGHSTHSNVGGQSITVVQRGLVGQTISQTPRIQSTSAQAPFVHPPQSGGGGGQSKYVMQRPRHAGRSHVHWPSELQVYGSSVTGQFWPMQGSQPSPHARPSQGSVPGHCGILEKQ